MRASAADKVSVVYRSMGWAVSSGVWIEGTASSTSPSNNREYCIFRRWVPHDTTADCHATRLPPTRDQAAVGCDAKRSELRPVRLGCGRLRWMPLNGLEENDLLRHKIIVERRVTVVVMIGAPRSTLSEAYHRE